MTKKAAKGDKKRKKSAGKVIRDQAILADSAAGMKNAELSEKYKLGPQRISEILNSPDAKARAALVQEEVQKMLPAALRGLFDLIEVREPTIIKEMMKAHGGFGDGRTKIEVTGKNGGPVKVEASGELKISLEERIKLLKGET